MPMTRARRKELQAEVAALLPRPPFRLTTPPTVEDQMKALPRAQLRLCLERLDEFAATGTVQRGVWDDENDEVCKALKGRDVGKIRVRLPNPNDPGGPEHRIIIVPDKRLKAPGVEAVLPWPKAYPSGSRRRRSSGK